MNKKLKLIIISIIVFILLIVIASILLINYMYGKLSNNTKLDTKNYLTAIEVKTNSNFILFINKNKKVSNIIFLDKNSVNYLFDKSIEKSNIEDAVEKIMDNIYTDEFTGCDFKLINYGDNNVYNEVKSEFNKQFVIRAIDKNIIDDSSSLSNRINDLDIKLKDNNTLKTLYEYSLDIVSDSLYGKEDIYSSDDIDKFSINGYKKLVKYASNVGNKAKDDNTKLNILDLNLTNNYDNPIYPNEGSWYYIENGKVFLNIIIRYNNKNYEYCYMGDQNYKPYKCE